MNSSEIVLIKSYAVKKPSMEKRSKIILCTHAIMQLNFILFVFLLIKQITIYKQIQIKTG